jgi:hypothetical protein
MQRRSMRWCWKNLRHRCDNPQDPAYKNYGAKGITYDPRWNDFEVFYAEMSEGWFEGATIDRKDAAKNYTKANCTWSAKAEQTRVGRLSVRSDNTTGVPGVEQVRNRWRVLVRTEAGKKTLYLGQDFDEACRIRWAWEARKKSGAIPILSRKNDPCTTPLQMEGSLP